MPRARWFLFIVVAAIIFGMISGAPVRPDVPSAIAEVPQPTTIGTPFGDTLMTDVIITVAPDD